MSDHANRRKHDRVPKAYRLELQELVFPLHQQAKIAATCEDVSAGGLAVVTRKKFAVGDKLQVRLYMARLNKFHPGFFKVFESDVDQSLQAVAEVVRVDERIPLTSYRLGLRFTDVYDDDWRALHGLLQDELRRQHARAQES
ncbi:PilZ domain-containing protein [Desulfovibrionales bacterium]|nr:PilZ domain-containing protein [Desulfovibrionales bacterium]